MSVLERARVIVETIEKETIRTRIYTFGAGVTCYVTPARLLATENT